MTDTPTVLTVDQAAGILKVDRDKVCRLLKEGAMPGRKVGGTWRIPYRRFIEWLEDGGQT